MYSKDLTNGTAYSAAGQTNSFELHVAFHYESLSLDLLRSELCTWLESRGYLGREETIYVDLLSVKHNYFHDAGSCKLMATPTQLVKKLYAFMVHEGLPYL